MYRYTLNFAGVLVMVGHSAAVAQDSAFGSLASNFNISGYVDHSYLEFESGSTFLTTAEVDLSFDRILGNWGVSLGWDARHLEGVTQSNLYPAVTYSFGDHVFSAGMTRPVPDRTYLDGRIILASTYIDTQLSSINGSTTSALLLQESDMTNLGLRWDGQFGNTKVGASYNRITADGAPANAHVYAAAIRHEMTLLTEQNSVAFFGSIERIEAADSATNWILGLDGRYSQFGYGASYAHNDLIGTGYHRAWLDYHATDNVTLTAELLGTPSDNYYSLGGAWRFQNGVALEATYVSIGDNELTDVSLRYEF
ncbi:hypothetical protein SAMN04488030_1269 [Aliiroseovarius halocynthiae]|uniref:Porin n=1 Tax=Aliiroseovarius halocynthiae TaxID=985055 RepID=A0A545SW37_9RHOB|nr:hypothetical protein [Aliiroseovarius halocynthiae]TQV69169.1 hypothetical protein FIL88_06285 [Aliiroseovarius halocynthiae]SMR71929.1 hypothetical protein SAMN04488030_1269 [Aliiroseovarius halocynthiae]